jgi:hypothetical protein
VIDGPKKVKNFKNKYAVDGTFALQDIRNALRKFEKAKDGSTSNLLANKYDSDVVNMDTTKASYNSHLITAGLAIIYKMENLFVSTFRHLSPAH